VDHIGGDSVKITHQGGGPVTIMGVERLGAQYNPTTNQATLAGIRNDGSQGPKVSRFSIPGSKIGNLVKETDAVSSLPYAFDYLKPDLSVIALMTNDGDQQTTVATYKASLDTCVARAKAAGSDVLIVGAPPYQSDATNAIKLTAYVAAAKEVAVARDAVFLDIPALWGSWVTANALGLFADALHPSQFGVPVLAQQVASAVRAMAN
jgi:lysophospholipase L1-like esterase